MASKKNSKTSKTAHVLTLLSGGAPTEERPETSAPDQPSAQEAPPPAAAPEPRSPLTPPILEVTRANSEALSATIQDALESALAEELLAETAEPSPVEASASVEEPALVEEPVSAEEPAPVEVPVPAEEPAPVEESVPAEEPAPVEESVSAEEPAPVEDPVSVETAASVEEPASIPAGQLVDGSKAINVMEVLVDEKMERYVRMFGLCRCPRCLADVKALALTNLPTKYVVLPAFAESPYMEVYRGRYASAVTAQILYACRAVMENPRHTLDQDGQPLGL